MILKERLIKILSEFHDEYIEVLDIPKTADEIIELFTDAIKNLEFKTPKHYHEKINSAFIFPPCKSFKGEIKTSSSVPDEK